MQCCLFTQLSPPFALWNALLSRALSSAAAVDFSSATFRSELKRNFAQVSHEESSDTVEEHRYSKWTETKRHDLNITQKNGRRRMQFNSTEACAILEVITCFCRQAEFETFPISFSLRYFRRRRGDIPRHFPRQQQLITCTDHMNELFYGFDWLAIFRSPET